MLSRFNRWWSTRRIHVRRRGLVTLGLVALIPLLARDEQPASVLRSAPVQEEFLWFATPGSLLPGTLYCGDCGHEVWSSGSGEGSASPRVNLYMPDDRHPSPERCTLFCAFCRSPIDHSGPRLGADLCGSACRCERVTQVIWDPCWDASLNGSCHCYRRSPDPPLIERASSQRPEACPNLVHHRCVLDVPHSVLSVGYEIPVGPGCAGGR